MNVFSVAKAHKIQRCLAKRIVFKSKLPAEISTVAGVDVAYAGSLAVGAAVVLNYQTLEILESQFAVCNVKMPYMPTLLSFRELPPSLLAIHKLKLEPDVFLVDAHGFAHPYRCGFASHLGVVIGRPTIGAAKSRLIGKAVEEDGKTGLFDNSEEIGAVVKTKVGAKPIFVSVGHMVSLTDATRVVMHCSKSRIPEPLLKAHELATAQRDMIMLQDKVNIKEN